MIFIIQNISKLQKKVYKQKYQYQQMQKWQEKQRQKIHQSIIQNAKPTIKRVENLAKSRQKNIMSTSRSKQLRTPNNKNSFLPFVKILELFQLQKYSNLLIQHGFPHNLADKKSMRFIDQILDQVEQTDQQRFLSLMNTLTIMSKDLNKNSNTNKPSMNHLKKQKSIKINNLPPPPSSSNLRQTQNFTNSSKKGEKAINFKVRHANNFKNPSYQNNQPYLSSKFSLSRPSRSTQRIKQARHESLQKNSIKNLQSDNPLKIHNMKLKANHSKTPKKQITPNKRAYDDIHITHSFKQSNKGIPTKTVQNNKIIERLTQKLKKMNPQKYLKPQTEDITLEIQKIKKMYLSFDSGTLTSNIGNIDLEQIIDCFVGQVFRLLDQDFRKKNQRIKASNRSYLKKQRPTPIKKFMELENKEEIQYLLKQSFVIQPTSSAIEERINPQLTANSQFLNLRERIQTEDIVGQSIMQQMQQIKNEGGNAHQRKAKLIDNSETKTIGIQSQSQCQSHSSDDIGVDYQIQSFVEDFTCFDNRMQQSLRTIQKEDIKNFVQLIVMAGKMQKQMPIIAYMYLKKLLSTKKQFMTKPKLTLFNWKNIVLVVLIQASKIWDDQSLQNHSFSKVLKPYTTYQINRLQKYFLFYIDYELTIDQKEYCQCYFQLRNHSKQAKKTAHLMSLDIKTIQNLQAMKPGIKKKQLQLKEYYKKKMDKSF